MFGSRKWSLLILAFGVCASAFGSPIQVPKPIVVTVAQESAASLTLNTYEIKIAGPLELAMHLGEGEAKALKDFSRQHLGKRVVFKLGD